jgi:hypothetical protein
MTKYHSLPFIVLCLAFLGGFVLLMGARRAPAAVAEENARWRIFAPTIFTSPPPPSLAAREMAVFDWNGLSL